jgi:hypothetical protein
VSDIQTRADKLLAMLPTAVKRQLPQTIRFNLEDTLEDKTLAEAIVELQEIGELYGMNAKIVGEEHYTDDGTFVRLHVARMREETNAEWMSRTSQELATEDRRNKEELETLQRLAAKHGYPQAPA